MSTLDSIKSPVLSDIKAYEELLAASFSSDNTLTGTMLSHVISSRGKGVRPLLVILCARLLVNNDTLPKATSIAAMMIEMIHTASLIHDDVIDGSDLRRGRPSVNSLWGSHLAVIIGDFILAKSFSVGMNNKAYEMVGYIAATMGELCEGELLQSDYNDRDVVDRKAYSDIIYKKTATLIGSSCGAGAMSVGACEADVRRLKDFGDMLGMAFQIKDDILDYMPSEKTGKPIYGDLREGKVNLPLLTVIENSPEPVANKITSLLSVAGKDKQVLAELAGMVVEGKGLEMASGIMDDYSNKAYEIISHYPDTIYKASLLKLIEYITGRER